MTATLEGPSGAASESLGIDLKTDPQRSIVDIEQLVEVAVRRNPKRAHLLVSTVLAKHVPTAPDLAMAAGEVLGLLVADTLDEPGSAEVADLGARFGELVAHLTRGATPTFNHDSAAVRDRVAELRRDLELATAPHGNVVTLGFAETATGLGQLVADSLGAYYLHSSRHAPLGATPFAGFAEEHSHATDHDLLPTDPGWLKPHGTVVLVDDELSTGTTVINTISVLHGLVPQRQWVVASLIDLRSAADRKRFEQLATELETSISVVCLAAGSITLPTDVLPRATRWIERMPAAPDLPLRGTAEVVTVDCSDLPPIRSARFGTSAPIDTQLGDAIAEQVRTALPLPERFGPVDHPSGDGVLVLGSEEFMALPMVTAHALQQQRPSADVRFSTSTRSPIAAWDQAGYPIRSAIRFRSHDLTSDGIGPRFAYNLTASDHRFETIVFMPEPGTDPAALGGDDGAIKALSTVCDQVIVVLLSAAHSADRTPGT